MCILQDFDTKSTITERSFAPFSFVDEQIVTFFRSETIPRFQVNQKQWFNDCFYSFRKSNTNFLKTFQIISRPIKMRLNSFPS